MIGNDAQNTPPTHALARRGIVGNVRGYLIYGDYRTANPAAAIIDAVAKGDVDVAVVWGPLAGYFAHRYGGLDITPVQPHGPMAFDIAMGVRRGEPGFKAEVDAALSANSAKIGRILAEYHVPVVAE
jgi:mxaJ protein